MRFRNLVLAIALAMGMLVFGRGFATAQGNAQEFMPDKNTLYLAHFDKDNRYADYANGWDILAGSGATLVDGYYGKALDLRGMQFKPDFLKTDDNPYPAFVSFGIWPRNNIDFYQGTFEFWFKVSPETRSAFDDGHLFFTSNRQLTAPGEISDMNLSTKQMTWEWYTLGGGRVAGKVDFKPALNPNDWHHLAMCWSSGEMTIYVDGRIVAAYDTTGKYGPLLLAQPQQPLYMHDIVLDELRISNVVRYRGNFEPRWHDGQRPAYAFEGVGKVQRYPAKSEHPDLPHIIPAPTAPVPLKVNLGGMTLVFDKKTGFVIGFGTAGNVTQRNTNGLMLWEGLDRLPRLAAVGSHFSSSPGKFSFQQEIGGRMTLKHELKEVAGSVSWKVTVTNLTDHELWLEALLGLPFPYGQVKEYYDMSYFQDKLPFARRVDDYSFSLPFAALAGASKSVGVGIDPHIDMSDLVSEYVPENGTGTVRQGTKFVVDPKSTYSLDWRIFTEASDFGARNALAHYQDLFPDLYKQNPAIPIYSYMGTCRHFVPFSYSPEDISRLCYSGMQWGHGPNHGKGDEWGEDRYWNMPKDLTRQDQAAAKHYEDLWKTTERLHFLERTFSEGAYYNAYTLRRSHYLPNWALQYVVEDLYPEGMLGGDPWVTAQYYSPEMYYANEYQTPLGKHYKQLTWNIMNANSSFSPGFINDMCQTTPMRFVDDIAKKTPGRAFAQDRGTFLVGAFGHADRYRMVNGFHDPRGFQQSIWSDGGAVSYQLSALGTANAVEGAVMPVGLANVQASYRAGRNLLGEKPMELSNEPEWTAVGAFFNPAEISPKQLRDVYRYGDEQGMLIQLKEGVYPGPEYTQGRQQLLEENPMLVESLVWGRKTVDAAKVNDPLFIRRSGEGMQSTLVIGNNQPNAVATPVELTNRFFGGRPIFGAYLGGMTKEKLGGLTSNIEDVTVAPRSITGFKILGVVDGNAPASVDAKFSGDGVTMQTVSNIDSEKPVKLTPSSFAPIYEIAGISVNGKSTASTSAVMLPAGKSTIEISYRTPVLPFTGKTWNSVDLIKDGKTNFCLVTELPDTPQEKAAKRAKDYAGYLAKDKEVYFDDGTAAMLNLFIEQYDEEDGVIGNLSKVKIDNKVPQGFDGWKIYIKSNVKVNPSRVRIDETSKSIFVEGKSTGEARRAMVVFMRLVDRKYPHIGRMFPLRGPDLDGVTEAMKEFDPRSTEFYRAYPDKDFLFRPILREENEKAYEGGNMNFEGKYTLRFSPYILEPTYSDNYVYGFTGK